VYSAQCVYAVAFKECRQCICKIFIFYQKWTPRQ